MCNHRLQLSLVQDKGREMKTAVRTSESKAMTYYTVPWQEIAAGILSVWALVFLAAWPFWFLSAAFATFALLFWLLAIMPIWTELRRVRRVDCRWRRDSHIYWMERELELEPSSSFWEIEP